MLTPDDLRAVRTLVVHDECADGLASAILLHDALPAAEIVFAAYGSAALERLEARPGMLFCDFSPPRARAAEFVRAGAIVLDHHVTARDVVLAFGERGVFGDERREPGVSGAVLAHRHVWLPLCARAAHAEFAARFALVAGVRDTWQRASEHWHEGDVQARVLLLLPRALWLETPLAEIGRTWQARFEWVGDALASKAHERARQALERAQRFVTPRGVRVLAFEGLEHSSDAADAAGAAADVVVAFGVSAADERQTLRLSLRSETDFDCGAFATRFGGGGHTRAAGFSLPLASTDLQPFTLIERLFSARA